MIRMFVAAGLALLPLPVLAAGQLPKGVYPTHYDITIRPNPDALSFTGSESIRITVEAPTKTITLNAADLDIARVTLNAEDVADFKTDEAAQTVTINLAEAASAGQHMLAFEFAGKINTSAAGLFALDYKTDDGKNARMLATQFEAPDARRFAPMWDEPSYKATFRLSSIAPAGQTAFSNMPIEKHDEVAGGGTLHAFADISQDVFLSAVFGMGDIERKTKMVRQCRDGHDHPPRCGAPGRFCAR